MGNNKAVYMPVIQELNDTFYRQELNSFLNSFVTTQGAIDAGNAPPTAPTSPQQVLKDIQELWDSDKNPPLHPAEIREALAQKYMPDADPKLLEIYSDVERSRYQPDAMTGYMQKPHLGLVSGFGHLYAQSTGRDVAMIEVDFSNMGGTNELYRALEAQAKGVPIENIPVEDVWHYTDDSAKLIAKTLQAELQNSLPEGSAILPVRSGGDELRLVVTGIEPSQYETVSRAIHSKIETHMAALNLHDHVHLKAPDTLEKNGFGAALTIVDMNALDPAHAVELADEAIKAKKIELGHTRLGGVDEPALKQAFTEFFDKNPGKIPEEMTRDSAADFLIENEKNFAQAKNAEFANLKQTTGTDPQAKADYINKEIQALNVDESRALGTKNPEYLNNNTSTDTALFSALAEQRTDAVTDRIANNGITVANDYEVKYLQQLTQSTTPTDPSAKTWMPNDLPETAEIYARDTETLKGQLIEQGIKPELANGMKAQMMGVAFQNLGGLNDALGHDGANVILQHMSQDIIGEALKQEGIKPGDYQIAHYGGAEFQILVKPAIGEDGQYKIIDESVMQRVQDNIALRTEVLDDMKMVDFLKQKGMPPTPEARAMLGEKTFSSIADVKPGRNISGMFAVTNNTPVEYEDRAGKFLYDHRQELDQSVDARRAEIIQQREIGTPKQVHSVANEVQAEINRVMTDSPNAVELIGGQKVLQDTADSVLELDTKFENRGEALLKTGGNSFETADEFTRLHVEDYRENGRPSLISQAVEFAEEIGLDRENPEYKAMIMVATRAEVANSNLPEYHSKNHYTDVTAMTGAIVRKNNELADAGVKGAIKYTPQEQALAFISALGHDLDHPGGKNPKEDPLMFEKMSIDKMVPFLEESGLSQNDIDKITTIIETTSPDGPHGIIKEVARAHRDGDAVDWGKVDPKNQFPQFHILENDPKLAQMAASLSDADLYASGAAGLKANAAMSELFTIEDRKAGADVDYRTDQARMGFFDFVIGKEGFTAVAGREIANDAHMAMREQTAQNLAKAEAEKVKEAVDAPKARQITPELDDIKQRMADYEPSSPLEHQKFLKGIDRELDTLYGDVFDREDMDPETQDKVLANIHAEIDQLPVERNRTLAEGLNNLPEDQQRNFGVAAAAEDASKFTVQYGNHRTAACLILYNKGELSGDEVIGKIADSNGNSKDLTVAELAKTFEDGSLHSQNATSRDVPYINHRKVEGIVNDFDMGKFFDPDRNGEFGVGLREVPADTVFSRYADVVDIDSESIKFSNYLYEQSHDAIAAGDAPVVKSMVKQDPVELVQKETAPELKPESGDAPPPEVEKAVKTDTPEVHTKAPGSKLTAGMSSAGVVMGVIGYTHAKEAGDKTGMAISGTDVAVSTADLVMDGAAAFGKVIAPAMQTFAQRANIVVMVADGAWQVSREEGLDNKIARGAAVTATTGTALGIGAAATTIAATGMAATVATIAAPLAAAVTVGIATDSAVEAYKITEELEDMFDRNEQAVKSRNDVEESGAPKLTNFKNLNVYAIKEGAMPDGSNPDDLSFREKAQIVREHEYSNDPEALDDLETRLQNKVDHYDKIYEENDSWVHDSVRHFWPGSDEEIDAQRDARIEGAHYKAALKEIKLYRQELTEHGAEQKATADDDAKPERTWEQHFDAKMLAQKEGIAANNFNETAKPDQAPQPNPEFAAVQNADPSLKDPGMI